MKPKLNASSWLRDSRTWIACMVLTFCAFLCLFAPSVFRERPSDASFDHVLAAVTETMDMTDYPQADQSVIRSKLGLDAAQFPGIYYGRTRNAMKAEEMLLIQYDPARKQEVLDAVNQRIQGQIQVYEGYAPEQKARTEQAVISVHPNYLLYITGDQARQAEKRFLEAL